jgi:hypothetical protein
MFPENPGWADRATVQAQPCTRNLLSTSRLDSMLETQPALSITPRFRIESPHEQAVACPTFLDAVFKSIQINCITLEKKIMKRSLKLVSFLLLGPFLCLGSNALASTVRYVNGVTGKDSNSGKTAATACKTIGHVISLSSAGDSILVAAATYRENLKIISDLTIVGAAAPTTIIDGGHTAAVVTISSATAHVNLAQLTLRNGSGLLQGGGGIYNAGTLALVNTTVSGNTSNDSVKVLGGLGGGIYNGGKLTIANSTITGNTVTRFHMGAFPAGGGIYNTGNLTITNSTLAANQASSYWPAGIPFGGGIDNENGTLMINNSTLSNNGAVISTPFGTVGTFGGGIYNHGTGTPRIQNSLFANNTLGGNCSGALNSLGYNLSSDNSCSLHGPGDQKGINPKLGPLQNNGGPTQTMALFAGSPAMRAGNPGGCFDSTHHRLTFDQRGRPRPDPGACDVGAYNH